MCNKVAWLWLSALALRVKSWPQSLKKKKQSKPNKPSTSLLMSLILIIMMQMMMVSKEQQPCAAIKCQTGVLDGRLKSAQLSAVAGRSFCCCCCSSIWPCPSSRQMLAGHTCGHTYPPTHTCHLAFKMYTHKQKCKQSHKQAASATSASFNPHVQLGHADVALPLSVVC